MKFIIVLLIITVCGASNGEECAVYFNPSGYSVTPSSGGSGWLYKPQWVITNRHVVDWSGASELTPPLAVRFKDEEPIKVRYFIASEKDDICLLKLERPVLNHKCDQISEDKLTSGTKVSYAGYPEFAHSTASGVVQNTFNRYRYISTTIKVNYGYSGSPIYNESGKVVGMGTQFILDTKCAIIMPISKVLEFLAEVKVD